MLLPIAIAYRLPDEERDHALRYLMFWAFQADMCATRSEHQRLPHTKPDLEELMSVEDFKAVLDIQYTGYSLDVD